MHKSILDAARLFRLRRLYCTAFLEQRGAYYVPPLFFCMEQVEQSERI